MPETYMPRLNPDESSCARGDRDSPAKLCGAHDVVLNQGDAAFLPHSSPEELESNAFLSRSRKRWLSPPAPALGLLVKRWDQAG